MAKTGPKPIPPEAAAEEVRALGYELQEGYPGRTTDPWRLLCLTCTHPWRSTLSAIRSGRRCRHLSEKPNEHLNKIGFIASEPYPGHPDLPWPVRCSTCTKEQVTTLKKVHRGGVRCPCEKEAKVVAEMQAAGYRPLVEYPGSARKPWPSECTTCKQERKPSLTTVRSGKRCRHFGPDGTLIAI
ncbi:hypothetical protein AB0I84_13080 [Streptomyces spectabilis]|uniref:hypothetical protein n=1 Tax=Streptomyces spectabilis TaxID=68270 RepID=UPI0033ED346F